MLARLAHLVTRHRWPVIGVWIVLTLFGGFAAGRSRSGGTRASRSPASPAYEANQRTLEGVRRRRAPAERRRLPHRAATRRRARRSARRCSARPKANPGALTSSYFSTGSLAYVSRDRHTTFMEIYPPGLAKFDTKSGAEATLQAAAAAGCRPGSPSTSPATTRSRRRARTARAAGRACCSRR